MSDGRFRYASCYCEENVWHLCQDATLPGTRRRVAFISNPHRTCALWSQRAAPSPGEAVFWDYHVVLLCRDGSGWQVWDLDTTLGMPVALDRYLQGTFPAGTALPERFWPCFRVLEASEYLEEFSSDRSHMRREDGSWMAPPPPWPAIRKDGKPGFLRLADMQAQGPGVVVSLAGLPVLLR